MTTYECLYLCVYVLVVLVFRSERQSCDGGREEDSENVLTVVIDALAHTGDKGSSPDSSTTKSELSFKMVA